MPTCFVEKEITHGRLAMAAFLGVITTYSGLRWPGYLSLAEEIKFSDLPGGAISSWAALPTASWLQIVIFVSFCEVYLLKQDPAKPAGDVVPDGWAWARYPDGYDIWLGDGSTQQVGRRAAAAAAAARGRRRCCSPPARLPSDAPPPSLTLQVGEEELFLGKTWKLNAERNNGRAAMMGITGMLIHEALTGNPVFPIGETL